jgi:hypothetical protein
MTHLTGADPAHPHQLHPGGAHHLAEPHASISSAVRINRNDPILVPLLVWSRHARASNY